MGNLKLTINGKEDSVRIGLCVVKILKDAEYLSIYLSPDDTAIMVKPCEEKEYLSIKVRAADGGGLKKDYRLYSHVFVETLMEKLEWDSAYSYSITGQYVEEKNAVVFKYKDAKVNVL